MYALRQICEIFDVQAYETEVLAASLRHPMHVVESALAGADIATMPYDVFTKLIKHPLTDKGLDQFMKDWERLQEQLKEGA
jgi:transaldolase